MQLNKSKVSLKLQKWYKLEQTCDAYNHQSFIDMDKSHLGKTKLKGFNSAVKRWHKNSSEALKRVSKLTFTTNKTFDYIKD